jgi:uncharacterized protein involved in outer membrane biogenesis
MLRIILIVLAIPVVLILLAALLVPLLVDKDQVIEIAARTLQEQTGAILTVKGESSLSVFPTLGITLGDAAIALPGEPPQTVQMRALEVGVQLLPLLSRQIEIGTLRLDGLNASILLPESSQSEPTLPDTSTMNNEQLDAFYAARKEAIKEGMQVNDGMAMLAAPLALNVSKLEITDARIELTDQGTGEVTRIEVVSLVAGNVNTEGESMTLAGKVRAPQALDGNTVELDLDTTLQLDLAANIATLEDLQLVIAGATPDDLQLTTSGTVDLARLAADLQLALVLGETEGSGSVKYASLESPQIDADLSFNLLDPALLVLAGPDAAAAVAEPTTAAQGDDALPLDALRQVDTRLKLAVTQARFGEYAAKDLSIDLRAVDGLVEIQRLTGDAIGGSFDLQATFNGRYNLATLTSAGQVAGLDLAQALSLAEVDEDLRGAATLDWTVKSQGRTISGLTEAINGTIELALSNASYNGQPLALQTTGDVDLGRQHADLTLAFGLAEMAGDGKVRYAGKQSPQIDATVHLNLLDPALLALAGPDAAQASQAEAPPADSELLPLATLREIDTHADLTIDKAVFDAHTINNLRLEATAKDGLIKVTTITGQVHGGQLNAGATLDATGDVARMSTRGAGKASTTWQLNSRGNSTDDLIANLRGPATLTTKGVVLKDIGIEKMLCQAVALVNQQKLAGKLSDDSVFKDLSMDIELGGGKARLKPLRADLNDVTLRGTGELDLQSENFTADFAAKLGAGLVKLDPACKINERYAAIDWPVACKGKISGDPAEWCGVDTGKIIADMATYEAKRKLKKEAGKLLDGLLKR